MDNKKSKILVLNSILELRNAWHLDISKYFAKYCDADYANIYLGGALPDFLKIFPATLSIIKLLPGVNKYKSVLSTSIANGIFFAFLQGLLGKRIIKPNHCVIDVGATRYLARAGGLVKFALSSIFNSVDAIICYSSSSLRFWEGIEHFKGKCFFVPLAVGDEYLSGQKTTAKDYIFSAGRYGRDFETLVKALSGTPIRLKIVGDKTNYNRLKKIIASKENIEYFTEIPLSQYNRMLQEASLVVLPLEKMYYHAGQTVLVQAMALGKAVIVSDTNGILDYIKDGEDGVLFKAGDADELREKILSLYGDKNKVIMIGQNAKNKAISEFSEMSFVDKIWAILKASN